MRPSHTSYGSADLKEEWRLPQHRCPHFTGAKGCGGDRDGERSWPWCIALSISHVRAMRSEDRRAARLAGLHMGQLSGTVAWPVEEWAFEEAEFPTLLNLCFTKGLEYKIGTSSLEWREQSVNLDSFGAQGEMFAKGSHAVLHRRGCLGGGLAPVRYGACPGPSVATAGTAVWGRDVALPIFQSWNGGFERFGNLLEITQPVRDSMDSTPVGSSPKAWLTKTNFNWFYLSSVIDEGYLISEYLKVTFGVAHWFNYSESLFQSLFISGFRFRILQNYSLLSLPFALLSKGDIGEPLIGVSTARVRRMKNQTRLFYASFLDALPLTQEKVRIIINFPNIL